MNIAKYHLQWTFINEDRKVTLTVGVFGQACKDPSFVPLPSKKQSG